MRKMKKLSLIALVLGLALMVLAGCGSGQQAAAPDNQNPDAADKVETITVKHALGEAVVKKNPQNVIVFDYGILDSLDVMGVEVLGLPKSNLPSVLEKYNADKYENAGALMEPDFEKIFELEPEVIFISARQASLYDQFAKIAPTVYIEVDGADYFNSVAKNTRLLGEIFDKQDLVEEKLAQIEKEFAGLKEQVSATGSNALVVLANDGSISAYGLGSRFGAIHNEFGFEPVDPNIEIANHGQSITFEYILDKNPDYLFIIDRAATVGGSVSAEQLFDNDIIKQTNAYKNEKIVYLSSQIWYVASGGLSGTMTMIEDVKSSL